MPGEPLSARLAQNAGGADKPNDLVAKVEERLREHPEDGIGWDVIAPVYYAMGRYADAAGAYANAIDCSAKRRAPARILPTPASALENGVIPEDARKALRAHSRHRTR